MDVAAVASRVDALEAGLQGVHDSLTNWHKELNDKVTDYEGRFSTGQLDLNRLCQMCDEAVKSLADWVSKSGKSSRGGGKDELLPMKQMIPERYEGDMKDWRKCQSDVEGYVEAMGSDLRKDVGRQRLGGGIGISSWRCEG